MRVNKKWRSASAALLLLILLLSACVDNTDGLLTPIDGDGDTSPQPLDGDADEDTDEVTPWAIAVVGTDYFSTSISILDRETQALFRENVIHSGSAAPGLSMALSGDVVIPSHPNPMNQIVLIDRYPNSVLTFIAPEDFSVIGQLPVGTGFASNPHDFLWLSDTKAYVTRYERNAIAGREAYDEGDDILIVDPVARTITGRIDLAAALSEEQSELQARPDRMVLAAGLVWVSLDRFSNDFLKSGDGLLLAVDPETNAVVDSVAIESFTNCTGIVYSPAREALYLSCSGMFASGYTGQIARSGIAMIDLSGETPQVATLRQAGDGIARPYGFDLELANERFLLAVRFGDLEETIPDRLVAIDLESGDEHVVHAASSAYGMGGVLFDGATQTLYVGDADAEDPGIHRYRLDDGNFEPSGKISASPELGLAPRYIRFY